jgi:hypothetical protein
MGRGKGRRMKPPERRGKHRDRFLKSHTDLARRRGG